MKIELRIAWWVVYLVQPVLILPGVLGGFGDEAKKSAEEILQGVCTLFVLALIGFVIYIALRYFGVL